MGTRARTGHSTRLEQAPAGSEIQVIPMEARNIEPDRAGLASPRVRLIDTFKRAVTIVHNQQDCRSSARKISYSSSTDRTL